jgi:transcriptional regulator with XRE-family HTH domain
VWDANVGGSHPCEAVLGSLAKTGCRQDVSERHGWRLGRPGSGAVVPLVRELDPTAGPLQFFGAELHRARAASGLSQDQLGQRLGYSGALVGKVEMGDRAPSQDFAQGCDQAFPQSGGLFGRIYELARRWDSAYPSWFAEWIDTERRATSLRSWEPLIIPGLLQTADYARAILAADPETVEDQLDELVAARLERQAIFDRAAPPDLWAVLDEAVLHRLIGTRKVMYDQLLHLADTSCRSNVTVQIVPAEIGAHSGLLGGFAIASFDNAPDTVYMESPDQGQTTEVPAVVRRLARTFDTLRADALPRGASRDLMGKVAEERWATT